jgi:hypothetical protein
MQQQASERSEGWHRGGNVLLLTPLKSMEDFPNLQADEVNGSFSVVVTLLDLRLLRPT